MNISRRLNGVQTLNVWLAYAPRLSALLLAILAPLVSLQAQSDYATPYTFTTLAGYSGHGSVDGFGSAAQFYYPGFTAVDNAGNVYVADTYNHTIRKITPAGEVTTLAGSAGNSGSIDGTGSAARFYYPKGIAVDASGNVYVADVNNYTIRKVTAGGVVTTIAGSAGSYGSADGAGSAARFYYPDGIAVDGSGNIFVAEPYNHTVRKITVAGVVSTLAGAAGTAGSADGTGTAARFNLPTGITVDGTGNLFVSDTHNYTIRKITPSGVVSTLAGSVGSTGAADGTGSAARFEYPNGLTVDGAGNVYVADSDSFTIRKITSAGVVTTFAGTAGNFGWNDGTGTAALFGYPTGVAVDASGNIFVSDSNNSRIRKITPGGVVTTLAGMMGRSSGEVDGTGFAARFFDPAGVAVDAAGNAYVTDRSNSTIRKITSTGVVTTFAGTVGSWGWSDGTGTAAQFGGATGITIDASGNLYVADIYNCIIRKITSTGVVTTFAGAAGMAGVADGTGSNAQFLLPSGVAVDGSGNVYVADSGNHTIRKITAAGVVSTLAGLGISSGFADGPGSSARFNDPSAVAVDTMGNIYVADRGNSTIRKITAAGLVTTFAGTAGNSGSDDGTGSAARFDSPRGVAVDGSGNVFVSDSNNSTIRKITAAGVVTTLAGIPSTTGASDGSGRAALFNYPGGLALDIAGNLYVADTTNNTIRKGVLAPAAPAITAQPAAIQSVVVGGSVTFTTTASGTPAPTFQWRKDGVNIPGATNNSYTLANTAAGDAGTYTVIVTNAVSSVTSIGALLQVEAAYTFTTLAGKVAIGSADGIGTAAQFDHPNRAAVDGSGNIYVSDGYNNTIRKITAAGVVTTFAGTAGISGSADGTGSSAQFHGPVGVAVDSSGNVYVADSGNHTIRRITSAGVVSTFAGVAGEPGSADGMGSLARFDNPRGVAVDGLGNVYVSSASAIRKISVAGLVTTLAGLADNPGSTGGVGSTARFNNPRGLTVDGDGNVYVADSYNYTVRKVTPAGAVTTLAGTVGVYGSADGVAGAASFFNLSDISSDDSGNLYVTDLFTIRKITSAGVVTTLASTPYIYGSTDAAGSVFNNPSGVTVDGSGNLFIAYTNNSTIQKITAAGEVTTFAGAAGFGDTDGTGSAARFNDPNGVAVDALGNIYVGDNGNQSIRKITLAGVVTTLANNVGGRAVAVDNGGNVYAINNNTEILKITPLGVVTILAGGTWGSLDGTGSAAQFAGPMGLAVDVAGNVYVSDSGNCLIRKITPAGVVTTLAGATGAYAWADGTGTAAKFNYPMGIAVDEAGFVFVADGNSMLRKITPAGVVTTLATEAAALGVAVDGAGNVYSTYGRMIKKTTPTGVVTTLAGSTSGGSTDGTGLAARFNWPWGIAVDGSGNIYVADSNNNTIRKGVLAPIVADATVILGDLSATYDGLPHAASATTVPASLTVDFTYDGSATAPTNAGTYSVVGTINSTNYQGSASGSLTIAKATPIITWAAPSAISYGTALSGTQLNATANVAGAFVYNPVSGTIPSVGTLALHTTFTPADTTNFHSVSAQQSLVINAVPVFTAQPVGRTLNPGQNAAFSIVASGGSPAPTYQWQMRVAGGGGWSDLTDGGAYSGTTTATLLISNVTLTMNGYQYRCLVTNSAGEIISNVGLLTVTTGIIAPSDAIITFTVE